MIQKFHNRKGKLKMYMITYRKKPATIRQLDKANNTKKSSIMQEMGIAMATRKECIAQYIYFYGFTWGERPKSIRCEQVDTVENTMKQTIEYLVDQAVKGLENVPST